MNVDRLKENPKLTSLVKNIDHIAVAVPDLEASIVWYRDVLGFDMVERRTTEGAFSGMVSAVVRAGDSVLVLVQGTAPQSQVSRYIDKYGPGVQHAAFLVHDLDACVSTLRESGMEFGTGIIEGKGIRQIFTKRDPDSGMMYEFIERHDPNGHFTDESVRELFVQLEANDQF